MKTLLLMVSLFFTAGMGLVYAQNPSAVDVKSAGYQRIVEIKNRVVSQREQIQKDLADKTIPADQAGDCVRILDQVAAQVALIAGSGDGTMLADDFESYNSFLDVNASLIDSARQVVL